MNTFGNGNVPLQHKIHETCHSVTFYFTIKKISDISFFHEVKCNGMKVLWISRQCLRKIKFYESWVSVLIFFSSTSGFSSWVNSDDFLFWPFCNQADMKFLLALLQNRKGKYFIIVVIITWPEKFAFVLLLEHEFTGIQA